MAKITEATLEVLPNRAELALAAARHWLTACRQAVAAQGAWHCALSGGNTPRLLYHCLATPWAADQVDWNRVWLWQVDERLVPPGDPCSNWALIRRELAERVPLPPGHALPMLPDLDALETPEAAARAYEALLRRELPRQHEGIPVFDLLVLGVGADGHTASLFPGSPVLEERRHLVAVTETQADLPRRITLTPPVIEAARELIFLVAGSEKAAVLARIFGEGDAALPVTRLRPRGRVRWLLDAAAAAQLPAGWRP